MRPMTKRNGIGFNAELPGIYFVSIMKPGTEISSCWERRMSAPDKLGPGFSTVHLKSFACQVPKPTAPG